MSTRYNFTLAGAGAYAIRALDTFTHVDASGNLVPVHAASSAAPSVSISGALDRARAPAAAGPPALAKRKSFRGCSAAQQNQISEALGPAQNYAEKAFSYASGIHGATARWSTWFGKYSDAHHNLVKSHYDVRPAVSCADPRVY